MTADTKTDIVERLGLLAIAADDASRDDYGNQKAHYTPSGMMRFHQTCTPFVVRTITKEAATEIETLRRELEEANADCRRENEASMIEIGILRRELEEERERNLPANNRADNLHATLCQVKQALVEAKGFCEAVIRQESFSLVAVANGPCASIEAAIRALSEGKDGQS